MLKRNSTRGVVERLAGAYAQRSTKGASDHMASESRYTAILADDHQIVRSGLRLALETPGLIEPDGISVLADVEDGLSAISTAKSLRPDLAILDVQMPRASGIEVVVEIKRWCPQARLVVFTGVTAPGLIGHLIDAGVDGLFTKSGRVEVLYEKLPQILRGGRFIDDSFVRILEDQPDTPELTGRERQTLNMIVQGQSNKEISIGLGISPKTVEKHRTSLMQKLGVNSVAQLLSRAVKDGLIDPSKEL